MPLIAIMNKRFSTLLIGAAMIGAILLTIPNPLRPAIAHAGDGVPFAPGEKLRFVLMWTIFPAGEASLEVLPMKTIDGKEAYHFRLTAESNAFVDLFYKVRDRIDAFVSADMSHAIQYTHKQREGDNRKDVQVRFDSKNFLAEYNDGQKNKTSNIQPGTFDPLGVFYYSRMADYKIDGVIACPVSDGNKCVRGQARIIREETIEIVSGTYKTYLIEPDLQHVGGVFEKDKDAKIRLWVTADEHRIPVKIASKVAIGSFVGELMTIEKDNS